MASSPAITPVARTAAPQPGTAAVKQVSPAGSGAPLPFDAKDQALIALGQELQVRRYRFTTVTPLTHQRVLERKAREAGASLESVFGWSIPFRTASLPGRIVALLGEADELETAGGFMRSKVRFATLGGQLFVHSAFPTDQRDAVFFGPDTYRFARVIRHELDGAKGQAAGRVIDVGCGSGAGGLVAATRLPGAEIVLADINPRALRFSRINAVINGIANVVTAESDLFAEVDGSADLIISNPPYLVDSRGRAYRHGGGEFGFSLSLRIVEEGLARLSPGGRLVLYTGTPVVDGTDKFLEALMEAIGRRGLSFTYEEIDPDVFGEELDNRPYRRADRIAAVALVVESS